MRFDGENFPSELMEDDRTRRLLTEADTYSHESLSDIPPYTVGQGPVPHLETPPFVKDFVNTERKLAESLT